MVRDNTIALIQIDKVCMWDFPELSASGDAQEEFRKLPDSGLSTYVSPRAVVAFPEEHRPEPDDRVGYGGLSDWYTGSRQPLMFDMWKKSPEAGYFEIHKLPCRLAAPTE